MAEDPKPVVWRILIGHNPYGYHYYFVTAFTAEQAYNELIRHIGYIPDLIKVYRDIALHMYAGLELAD